MSGIWCVTYRSCLGSGVLLTDHVLDLVCYLQIMSWIWCVTYRSCLGSGVLLTDHVLDLVCYLQIMSWIWCVTYRSCLGSGRLLCKDIMSLAYWLYALFFHPSSYFFFSSGDNLSFIMRTARFISPGKDNVLIS